jgi:hypothetical protein
MERYKTEHGLPIDAVVNPEDLDPDNPDNYIMPEHLKASTSASAVAASGSTSDSIAPPGEDDSSSVTSFKDQVHSPFLFFGASTLDLTFACCDNLSLTDGMFLIAVTNQKHHFYIDLPPTFCQPQIPTVVW